MNMKFLAVVTPPSIYHYISKPEAQSRAGGYFSSEKIKHTHTSNAPGKLTRAC